MNLPNALSLTRIFLVPLMLVVMLTGNFPNREVWGLVIFLAAAMTDFLDGYLARRRSQVTTVGKLLDPVADKILISATFVALVELGVIPAWAVVIVIGREFAVTGLRAIASSEGLTIDASRLGKYKMVAQVVCCSFLIAGIPYPQSSLTMVGEILLWLVVVLAISSMAHYFRVFWGQIDESAKARRRLEGRITPPSRKSDADALIKP